MAVRVFILGKDYKTWFSRWYGVDWAIVAVLFLVVGIVSATVEPRHRYLPFGDSDVAYPLKTEIVPTWLLLVLTLILPIFVFSTTQFWTRSRHDLHHALLGSFLAWVLTLAVTAAVKISVGRYRPNYESVKHTWDGRTSFPSGHASSSFCAMTFLSMFLMGKMKVFVRNHSGSVAAKTLLGTSPMLLAIFIAISRVIDYHHTFSDITAGAVLGTMLGQLGYYLYFHPLTDDNCDLPKAKYHHPQHTLLQPQHEG